MAADRVDLYNSQAEQVLVGTMLMTPVLLQIHGQQIESDWFTDSTAQCFFEAAMRAHESGGEVSATSVLGHLPDSANDQDKGTLAKLYMALTDRAVGPDQFTGVMNVVRDRWARRSLVNVTKFVESAVQVYDTNPYALAGEITAKVDRVTASQSDRDAAYVDRSSEKVIAHLKSGAQISGATTGIAQLDNLLNGYKSGQFYVIAARPAMGKSAFALSSLARTAMAGHGVAFYSMEMTEEEVVSRLLADIADDITYPSFGDIMRGKVHTNRWPDLERADELLDQIPLHIDYTPSLTAAEIAARARQTKMDMAQKGQKLDVVCIDHLTEIAPSQRYSGNPVMEISEIAKRLRVLAKELDCCVVALCQLSREVEKRNDKRPQLSDLRWTGEIEQAAHVVGFLYREEYYLKNDPDADIYALQEVKNVMDFLIRKNRQGETGDVRLWCDMAHSAVRDKA